MYFFCWLIFTLLFLPNSMDGSRGGVVCSWFVMSRLLFNILWQLHLDFECLWLSWSNCLKDCYCNCDFTDVMGDIVLPLTNRLRFSVLVSNCWVDPPPTIQIFKVTLASAKRKCHNVTSFFTIGLVLGKLVLFELLFLSWSPIPICFWTSKKNINPIIWWLLQCFYVVHMICQNLVCKHKKNHDLFLLFHVDWYWVLVRLSSSSPFQQCLNLNFLWDKILKLKGKWHHG